jgi:hypothetical protein
MEAQLNQNRAAHSNWLWGALLIVLGLIFLVSQSAAWDTDDMLPVIILAGVGTTFLIVYRNDRERRWPLIPASGCWAIAGGLLLGALLSPGGLFHVFRFYEDEIIGAYVACVISAPFIYFLRRTRKHWLLIVPAIALAAAGGAMLDAVLTQSRLFRFLGYYFDALMGTYVAAVLSAPFVYAYAHTRKPGWLILPFMALAIVGGITLDLMISQGGPLYFLNHNSDEIMGAYVAAVFAAPFFYLHTRDRRRWWALAAGGVLASISVGCLLAGLARLIPVALIGVGIFLLARQFVASRPQPALTGPEADQPPATQGN